MGHAETSDVGGLGRTAAEWVESPVVRRRSASRPGGDTDPDAAEHVGAAQHLTELRGDAIG